MIVRLHGTLLEKNADSIALDVQGVVYGVHISLHTLSTLPAVGQPVQLWTHLHVREDAWSLYGFASPEERGLFLLCTSVSGIGPKLGLSLLSGLEPAPLTEALQMGDLKTLCRIPGIGKKTAERLVLELRDKLPRLLGTASKSRKATTTHSLSRGPASDIATALINLGYRPQDAESAAEQAMQEHPHAALADWLRQALRLLQR